MKRPRTSSEENRAPLQIPKRETNGTPGTGLEPLTPRHKPMVSEASSVEQALLKGSIYKDKYPSEKMRALVVENFPALGKASAFRFLEWVQKEPRGLASLPTGKTPEYFIKWVQRALAEWDTPAIQEEIKNFGLDPKKPDMSQLTFVQIDEFYPISPNQHNSFYSYVMEFYIKGFGMNPDKAMLMDCTKIGLQEGETLDSIWPDGAVDLELRWRTPASHLEYAQQRVIREVDQWCAAYEQRIRIAGGIGFFMGGIGPDGHVAFNCLGNDHNSSTRLDKLNYPSQAAAAGDLGGIEAVRKRKVITIGLGTISYNPQCVAIIAAAGEAKAKVVQNAVEKAAHVLYPATALHKLPNACLYITKGAAKYLTDRLVEEVTAQEKIADTDPERILVPLSCALNKRLVDLTEADLQHDKLAECMVRKSGRSLGDLAAQVRDSLIAKIERGSGKLRNTTFLHTEPHHDDVMLGYLPGVIRNTREPSNVHHFVCGTSGFNSVSNKHMLWQLDRVRNYTKTQTFRSLAKVNYFDPGEDSLRRRDVWTFLDGVAAADEEIKDEGAARRLIRNIVEVFKDEIAPEPKALLSRVKMLKDYFDRQYAGQKDNGDVQLLKGMCREFEAEVVWGYLGWNVPSIKHLRLGFYTADIFAPEPTMSRDAAPIVSLMRRVKPEVVTVALDPEASGPDTHYKVLQAVTAALELYVKESGSTNMKVWGYRNVWFRFQPFEVTTIFPVSLMTIATLDHMFLSSFESQKNAEFPAHELEGPFCDMSRKVQVEQYNMIKTCLGAEWFNESPSALIRGTRGLVFLKEMDLNELIQTSRGLRKSTEGA